MPADTAAAALPAFTGVFTFGDSLVDPGNDLKVFDFLKRFPIDNLPDGAPTADKGYFAGRFSNGFNFADLVSNKAIHQATTTTFPYGISNELFGVSVGSVGRPDGNNLNFAYGGAQIAKDNPAPALTTQLDIYHNFTPDPNALYLISVGANDVLQLVPTGGTPTTGQAATDQLSNLASTLAQQVAQLYARGVQHIVVANLPDLGVVPAYNGAVDEATRRSLLTQYAQTFDTDLKADLNAISLPSGATLTDYDFFAYTQAVKANPAAFGFSNVTEALTTAQPTNPAATGDGFLFFDKLHPTAQAHAQIAAEILNQVANPGAADNWTAAASIGSRALSGLAAGAHADYAATLTGGQTYVLDALGTSSGNGTLPDPMIRVLDSSGNVVAQADDGGLGLDSHLQFTAASTGSYTIEVDGVGISAGSYALQAGDGAGTNLLLNGAVRGSNMLLGGGAGADTLAAVAGSNVLMGNDGDDSILGGTGFDQINGNKGNDTIVGVSQVGDWLRGGQGTDSITAGQSTGHNIINGDLGSDTVLGGSGGDTLRGGQGDDLITGGTGADWLSGDLGHDTLTGGGGADTFHGTAGTELITDFNFGGGDRVQLDPGVTFTLSQPAQDTIVQLSDGGQITLAGVSQTSLTTGWFFNA